MKNLTILLAFLIGCSSEGGIDTGTYPPDAGEGSSSGSSSSSGSCLPISWNYGEDRFCEQCACPGTKCKTHALSEELFVGVCDEKLNCSAECRDPLWLETHDGG